MITLYLYIYTYIYITSHARLAVFEEKLTGSEPNPAFVGGNGELIIPTDILRHTRNDSRILQLEYR